MPMPTATPLHTGSLPCRTPTPPPAATSAPGRTRSCRVVTSAGMTDTPHSGSAGRPCRRPSLSSSCPAWAEVPVEGQVPYVPLPPVLASGVAESIYPSVQNLLLAAGAMGLGANLVTLPLWSVTSARKILGLPPSVTPYCVVPRGWPGVATGRRHANPSSRSPTSTGTATAPGSTADRPGQQAAPAPGMAALTRASARLAAIRARRVSRDPGAAAAETRRSAIPAW